MAIFGYITVNKQEMKFKDFYMYQSYYCGLCKSLKKRYGRMGQLTLSYDLTFLIILLTSLYEPRTFQWKMNCISVPVAKRRSRNNQFSEYAADMNLLLAYYKFEDDWSDERRYRSKGMALLLKRRIKKVQQAYPQKAALIQERFKQIARYEAMNETDIDKVSGCFGEIMGTIFAVYTDEWERDLTKIGFFLGKFVYLADAYEDIEQDQRTGNYNPFLAMEPTESIESFCEQILTMMMAECSKAFEKLPLLKHIDILRNILYSGVWCHIKKR
jgi:hypothetical protein